MSTTKNQCNIINQKFFYRSVKKKTQRVKRVGGVKGERFVWKKQKKRNTVTFLNFMWCRGLSVEWKEGTRAWKGVRDDFRMFYIGKAKGREKKNVCSRDRNKNAQPPPSPLATDDPPQ